MGSLESNLEHQTSLSLNDAIRIAKEHEQRASDYYAQSAKTTKNETVIVLLTQLAEFEILHYNKIIELELSLKKTGEYIEYVGTELIIPSHLAIRLPELTDRDSTMKIITEASDLEIRAENGYQRLAEATSNLKGHDMFLKLAAEEHIHFLLLKDIYWNLNNLGVWKSAIK